MDPVLNGRLTKNPPCFYIQLQTYQVYQWMSEVLQEIHPYVKLVLHLQIKNVIHHFAIVGLHVPDIADIRLSPFLCICIGENLARNKSFIK